MVGIQNLKQYIKPIDLARELGIPATTVYSWVKIPSWRVDAVMKVLKKHKIPVKKEDFYKGEE